MVLMINDSNALVLFVCSTELIAFHSQIKGIQAQKMSLQPIKGYQGHCKVLPPLSCISWSIKPH